MNGKFGEKQRANASYSGDLRVLTEHDPYYTQRMATCFSLKQFPKRGLATWNI